MCPPVPPSWPEVPDICLDHCGKEGFLQPGSLGALQRGQMLMIQPPRVSTISVITGGGIHHCMGHSPGTGQDGSGKNLICLNVGA